MTDLDKLIDAVEAGAEVGSGPSANMCDAAIPGCLSHAVLGAFNGSLDAAKALNDALLPNWTVANIGHTGLQTPVWAVWIASTSYLEDFLSADGRANNPARAWLIAILKGYRTTQEANP